MKIFVLLAMAAVAFGQQAPAPLKELLDPQKKYWAAEQDAVFNRLLVEQKARAGLAGRWWSNPETAQKLNLTPDQLKKMDDIFQQHRIRLIDLNANLQKAELVLEPLVAADSPDDAKVLAQIDQVAQARADLEKANSRMLWGIRRVLTPEQWKTLQSDSRPAKVLRH